MRRRAMVMSALLVVSGFVSAAPADFCARVLVGTEAIDPQAATGSTYSAREVEDLRLLVVFLDPVEGDHLVELRLVTPRGHLYQVLTAPVTSVGGERAATTRTVAGYPDPLPVQALEQVRSGDVSGQGVGFVLPVAGTSIVSSGLYGRWRVEVLLDGGEMACEVLNSFVLHE